MSVFLPLWISYPHFIHNITAIYRLNISTRYIVFAITGLSTSSVDKFSTFYPQKRPDIAAQYIIAMH